jgi:hypothetical protein
MDFKTLFRRMEDLNPDFPVISEGNSTEELPKVAELFHNTAKELGIRVLEVNEEPATATR